MALIFIRLIVNTFFWCRLTKLPFILYIFRSLTKYNIYISGRKFKFRGQFCCAVLLFFLKSTKRRKKVSISLTTLQSLRDKIVYTSLYFNICSLLLQYLFDTKNEKLSDEKFCTEIIVGGCKNKPVTS